MRKPKIKFNTDEIFLEGQHTPEQKLAFTRSPLLSIALALYAASDKTVRVGYIRRYFNEVREARIVTPEGFNVARISYDGTDDLEFACQVASDNTSASWGGGAIESKNRHYVCKHLAKDSKHPVAKALRRTLAAAPKTVASILRRVVDSTVNDFYGNDERSHRAHLTFSSETEAFLAHIAMGKATMAQMPREMRQEFEAKYRTYEARSARFNTAISKAKEFYDRSKWGLVRDINDGIILFAIDNQPVVSALDIYNNSGSLPDADHSLVQYVVPPKWYPNYDAIPEEYRRELDYALMVLKTHAGGTTHFDGMFPSHNDIFKAKIWGDIGAAVNRNCILLPR